MRDEGFYSIRNDEWLFENKDRLLIGGPLIVRIGDLDPEMHKELINELRINSGIGTPVSAGLGMGWPELKDMGVKCDFVDELETIKLDERTTL